MFCRWSCSFDTDTERERESAERAPMLHLNKAHCFYCSCNRAWWKMPFYVDNNYKQGPCQTIIENIRDGTEGELTIPKETTSLLFKTGSSRATNIFKIFTCMKQLLDLYSFQTHRHKWRSGFACFRCNIFWLIIKRYKNIFFHIKEGNKYIPCDQQSTVRLCGYLATN